MADITRDKLPLPLTRRISDRPPSDRLPLTLNRKLSTLDVVLPTPIDPVPKPTDPTPKRQNPVMAEFDSLISDPQGVNMGRQVSIASDEVARAYGVVYGDTLTMAYGRDMSTRHFTPVASGADSAMGTPYLIGSVYQHTWQALRVLKHAHHISVGGGVGLFSCNLVKYGAKGYLQGGTQGRLSDVIGLFGDNTHKADSTPIAHPSMHTITHSTPVPCRYYPIPEPEPDKPISYCSIRPSSDRLPLALRHRRGQYASDALPLAMVCWHEMPPASTPNLRSYIVHNTITATIGGVNVNPLSFSIKTDMDSHYWQGQSRYRPKTMPKSKTNWASLAMSHSSAWSLMVIALPSWARS